MSRYIDADTATIYLSKSAGEQLDRVPTADVQEVKHGKWIAIDVDDLLYCCSECGKTDFYENNFCKHCGAKMDGENQTKNIYNCEICKNLCCDGCEMYEGAKMDGDEK